MSSNSQHVRRASALRPVTAASQAIRACHWAPAGSFHTGLVRVLLLALLTSHANTPALLGQPEASVVTMNPAFATDMSHARAPAQTADGQMLGARPSPLPPIGHLGIPGRPGIAALASSVLPAAYDLRTATDKLPPVRDQGSSACCWAFAAQGSLESCLRPTDAWDFSENNLKNTHGFDYGPNDGGNSEMAIAYMTRWGGPVSEADDPYDPSSVTSPSDLTPRKHIQDIIVLPTRTSIPDTPVITAIKQAVVSFGAVQTSMHWRDADYQSATYAYYHSGGALMNHAVAIVGWVDSFPASSFRTMPPGDGAFIVRNSWGAGWGQAGYLYISYYDTRLGLDENTVYCAAEPATTYARVYQHDPFGRAGSLGVGGAETVWGANVFTAAGSSEEIRAVGTYAPAANTSYEVRVYRNPSPLPAGGTPVGTRSGTFAYAGYHVVGFDTPVALSAGDRFSVVVRLTTAGSAAALPVEYQVPGYTSAAAASAGQSYRSANGTSWMDLTALVPTGNLCIKAFAGSATPTVVSVAGVSATRGARGVRLSFRYTDTTPMFEFAIRRRSPDGHQAVVATIPWALGCTDYECEDSAGSAGERAEYEIVGLSVSGEEELLWPCDR